MAKRRTQARLKIAVELLARRDATHWGYDLSRNAGVGAGSMYPFLAELLESGFLSDGWENAERVAGRPPRRFYQVTDEGEKYLRDFLSAAPAPQAGRAIRLRPGLAES